MRRDGFSLYVHIPFCRHRCPYCDFNTYVLGYLPEREYVAALLSELRYRAALPEWQGRSVATVFFGGGTPSLLAPESLHDILQGVREHFDVEPAAEISLEANPGTVDDDKLLDYRRAGINRLSFGAQSFDATVLRNIERIHSADDTRLAIELARASGFRNLSIDLMYGCPGQTTEAMFNDIDTALACGIEHLSLYGLTIEKGTPFYTRFRRGQLKLPNEDVLAAMFKESAAVIEGAGFRRYEISNYAKPGFEARHNLAYWNGSDYLAVGAGAHSYFAREKEGRVLGGRRWSNYAVPGKYIREASGRGSAESRHEDLGPQELVFEFFFLGLRKLDGVDCREFERKFGTRVEDVYGALPHVLVEEGMLRAEGTVLALSERGLQFADTVLENFARPDVAAIELREAV